MINNPRDLIRKRLGGLCTDTSVAMAALHDDLHGTEGGWLKCEQEPCNSVGILMGELALVLMEIQGSPN